MVIDGVAVSDGALLAQNILFTVLCFFIIAVGVAGFFLILDKDERRIRRRIKERIKALENVEEKNPKVQKRLEKSIKALKKRRKNKENSGITFAFCTCTLVFLLVFFILVIPGWVDYSRKDYIVYEGEFECFSGGKNSYILLDDGTKLDGRCGLSSGEYYGRIVYSRRTRRALGTDAND